MNSTNAPSPSGLIETAKKLAKTGRRGKPRQTDLRRAISTVYYALFHTLSESCADLLVGKSARKGARRSWAQAYRALQHGRVKAVCSVDAKARVRTAYRKFSDEIQAFGSLFVELQKKREEADYDPLASHLTSSEVLKLIEEASSAIEGFKKASAVDKRAFCSFVVFDLRS